MKYCGKNYEQLAKLMVEVRTQTFILNLPKYWPPLPPSPLPGSYAYGAYYK